MIQVVASCEDPQKCADFENAILNFDPDMYSKMLGLGEQMPILNHLRHELFT